MAYRLNLGEWNDIFAVPKSVVNKYIKLAKEDYIKVLLVILANAGKSVSENEISELCGVSQVNVKDAILFWCEHNIIDLSENEITPFKSESCFAEAVTNEQADIKPIDKILKKDEGISEISVSENVKIKTRAPITLSLYEVSERINSADELKWAVSQIEKLFSKLLTQSEISVIVFLYDYAGLSADIIIMIAEYCASIDKANMRFVEKTAYSWIDKGIDTHQKIENHITELITEKNNEALIKSAFGIWDRNLTTKQKEYLPVWLEKWGFSVEMIKLAYEMCIDNTGKLAFPYINKILNSWYEKGIKTPKDVEDNEKSRKQSEAVSSTFDAKEFDDISSYVVPDLSKKKGKK